MSYHNTLVDMLARMLTKHIDAAMPSGHPTLVHTSTSGAPQRGRYYCVLMLVELTLLLLVVAVLLCSLLLS